MESNNVISEETKALFEKKERLRREIQYFKKAIEDIESNCVCDSSSDSDEDYSTIIETGPSMKQLICDRSMVKVCLEATQELTNLQILEFENNVISEPVLSGEPPVTERGTWCEVMAECKIDLVPFSITFYTHTPNRQFAPTWYRSLKVTVVKGSHDAELSKSILPSITKPSEAVAVLKSYAVAFRSRRETLARLADLHSTSLSMMPATDAGYLLKCENSFEISWKLENERSPFLPFRHRLNFELEYIDEDSINKVKQTYKQLSNPSITTLERTGLLSKMISVCLEAKK